MAISIWAIFRFPLGGWIINTVRDDPWNLWWFVVVPSAAWTALKIAKYLGSFQIVTNLHLHKGSTGWLLMDDPLVSIERSKMTNSAIKRGAVRTLLGYYLMKREGVGEEDSEWRHLRVRYGPEMRNALGG
jgi:hypothetical protein